MNPFKEGDLVEITGDLIATAHAYGLPNQMRELIGEVMTVTVVHGSLVKASLWNWHYTDLSLVNYSLENE